MLAPAVHHSHHSHHKDKDEPTRDPPGVTPAVELESDRAYEGAAVGLTVGATGGMFAALGAATGVIPGLGPLLAGGIFAGVIAASAIGGVVGSVAGALVGQGVTDREAVLHAEEFDSGRVLLVVQVADTARAETCVDILRRHSAQTKTHPLAGSGARNHNA